MGTVPVYLDIVRETKSLGGVCVCRGLQKDRVAQGEFPCQGVPALSAHPTWRLCLWVTSGSSHRYKNGSILILGYEERQPRLRNGGLKSKLSGI